MHAGEDRAHLLAGEHHGEALLAVGADEAEGVPVAAQHVLEEEADPAVADAKGGGGPLVDVSPVEEVVLELGLGDLVGGLGVELNQHAHGAGVGILGALALAVELEGLDGLLVPVGHHGGSPVVTDQSPRESTGRDRRAECC